jgi:dTDP-glucose pyrophosphorylase/CBS domain-containing protein
VYAWLPQLRMNGRDVSQPQDERLGSLTISLTATIRDALRRIEDGGAEIALVVDREGRLEGTLTDGDVRRGLLAGATLDDPVEPLVTREPITVGVGMDRAAALDLMRARSIAHLPEIDASRRLTGVHLMRDVIGPPLLPNRAIVIAGGRGTRLGALTHSTPKPMLQVAGRPIIERIVLHLVGAGIRHLALSIGYLGEQIRDHLGDGSQFGCTIEYLVESPERPLGTGGPLRLLLDLPCPPTGPMLVMNGDLLTSFSVSAMLRAHAQAGAIMTVGVKEYVHDVPFGVVRLDDGVVATEVVGLEEKPRASWPVNAGTYVLDPQLLERIPAGLSFPITDLVTGCLERGERVLGWPLDGDWQDIGRPSELDAARGRS